MTSTQPRGTIDSVASLIEATLYQGNPDRNHKLWIIVSTERCMLHMQMLLECCYIQMEEQFDDTNGVIRIRISKKNRQRNGQKKKYKRTNNDLQSIHLKLKIE
jgi:hypothetical protein